MPTYDYQCRSCGVITEVVHSMLEEGPRACERCGGELRRLFHPTGIIFKGGGFYKTDSRSSSAGSDPKTSRSASGGSGDASAATTPPSDGGSAGKGTSPAPSSGGDGGSGSD